MQIGQEIVIRPDGKLDCSPRKKHPTVYFGTKTQSGQVFWSLIPDYDKTKKKNDVILSDSVQDEKSKFAYIIFNNETQSYEIADLGGGTGTYIKVEQEVIFQNFQRVLKTCWYSSLKS